MTEFDALELEKLAEEALTDDKIDIKQEYYNIFFNKFLKIYKETHNLRVVDPNDPEIIKEYNFWLKKQVLLLGIYIENMKKLKWSPNNRNIVGNKPMELFKGDLDSLKKTFSRNLIVYSKYGCTIGKENYKDGVHSEEMGVRDYSPSIITYKFGKKPTYLPLCDGSYSTLYIHNPYDHVEEQRINSLLFNDSANIVYGLFGLTLDPELEYKMHKFSDLYKELFEDDPNTRIFQIRTSREDVGEYQMGLIFKPKK
jgi:hypothetical protein